MNKRLLTLLLFALLLLSGRTLRAEIIHFADANVKAVCVSAWDTDKDRELSEEEAAAVTSLGTVLNKIVAVMTSFDELKYFTGLNTLTKNTFYKCTRLKSITVPANITHIENQAFYMCTKLEHLTVEWTEPPAIATAAFTNTPIAKCSLHIPLGTLESYEKAPVWKSFKIKSGILSITDPQVKATCIREWDTDRDGEICEAEVRQIHDLKDAFRNNTGIKCFDELSYFTNLDAIGAAAFFGCSSLKSVSIPKSVTGIGAMAFSKCASLDSVSIPESVTKIGSQAFYQCMSLRSIDIPENVKALGNYAFAECSHLKDITVHWPVPLRTDARAFGNVASDNCNLHIPLGSLLMYTKTDTWRKFNIESAAIVFTDSEVKNICVKKWDTGHDGELSEAEAMAVTDIGNVFAHHGDITCFDELQYFTGLKAIVPSAFYGCTALQSAILPEGIATIGPDAFYGCSSLQTINIPGSVTGIGGKAFSGCTALKDVTAKWETPLDVDIHAFDDIVLGECRLHFPVGNEKAWQTSETWNRFLLLPDMILFADAKVKALCLHAWDTDGNGELSPEEARSVSSIGTVFQSSDITLFDELIHFTGLDGIADNAFNGCTFLRSVTIPDHVTDIGDGSFSNCQQLKKITIWCNCPPAVGEHVFDGVPHNHCTLLYPVDIEEAYRDATVWNSFNLLACIRFKDSAVKEICIDNWDTDRDGILSLTEASGIKHLGNLFYNNPSITRFDELKYFSCMDTIDRRAFGNCTSLESIAFPDNMTYIADFAFYECKSLKSITIPHRVQFIDSNVFHGCSSLGTVIFKSLPEIGSSAFDRAQMTVILVLTGSEKPHIGSSMKNYPSCGFAEATYHFNVEQDEIGSIILPFSFDAKSVEGLYFYELTDNLSLSSTNANLTFKRVKTCAAEMPYLFVCSGNSGPFTITSKNPKVGVNAQTVKRTRTALRRQYTLSMTGSFTDLSLPSGSDAFYYQDGSDTFSWHESLNIPPYTAYFITKGIFANELTIRFDNSYISSYETAIPDVINHEDNPMDETETVYDVCGKQLSAPQPGQLNIIRTPSGKTIKIMMP